MSRTHSRTIDRLAVFEMIKKHWPTHVTQVAEEMGYIAPNSSFEERKAVLAHMKYHFDQLARDDKIKIKKIGQAVVAWPHDMEKMRIIHSMLE